VLLNNPKVGAYGGGSEAANALAAPAIAAALHDATGKVLRRLPLKPAYVQSLLKAWPGIARVKDILPMGEEQGWPRTFAKLRQGTRPSMAKKKEAAKIAPKVSEAEQDLLTHMADGYQLETDLLGGNPVLRNLKNDEAIRPLSANRNSIKALQERGLITPGKGHDPLTISWRLNKTAKWDHVGSCLPRRLLGYPEIRSAAASVKVDGTRKPPMRNHFAWNSAQGAGFSLVDPQIALFWRYMREHQAEGLRIADLPLVHGYTHQVLLCIVYAFIDLFVNH
jgi:hypothetical protein